MLMSCSPSHITRVSVHMHILLCHLTSEDLYGLWQRMEEEPGSSQAVLLLCCPGFCPAPSLTGSGFCPCACSCPLNTKISAQHKQGWPSFLLSKHHINTIASTNKFTPQLCNGASVSTSLFCQRESAVAALTAPIRPMEVASESQNRGWSVCFIY